MAANKYFAHAKLNLLAGTAIHTPSSVKCVLCTNSPTRNDTNGTLIRPTYSGYADVTITGGEFSSIVDDLTTGSTISNTVDITFPAPGSSPGSPITINGCAVIDDANNVLYQTTLVNPLQVITAGQVIKIPIGSLVFSEN